MSLRSGTNVPGILGRSKRQVSQMQIQIEVIKSQLADCESALGSAMVGQCSTLESEVFEYLFRLAYLIEALRHFDVATSEDLQQFCQYLEETDWGQFAGGLHEMVAIYKSLPHVIQKQIDMPFDVIDPMMQFCRYLSDCVFQLSSLSAIESRVADIIEHSYGVLDRDIPSGENQSCVLLDEQ